jgi:hypothetical protein
MRYLSDVCIRLAFGLLIATTIPGCVSLRVDKVADGVDVAPPNDKFARGKTSLGEVLSNYGAPDDVVDMNRDFALHFRRALYTGVNVSFGVPLKNILLPNPSVVTAGSLNRYDTVVFIFSADNVLKDIKYEKGRSRSLWEDYW